MAMKKRIGLLLVIVVLAWALVACGGGGNDNDNVDGGVVEPTAEGLATEVVGTPSDLGGEEVEEMPTAEP